MKEAAVSRRDEHPCGARVPRGTHGADGRRACERAEKEEEENSERALRKERCSEERSSRTERPQSGRTKDHKGPPPLAVWRLWRPLREQPLRRNEGQGLSSIKLKNE